MLDADPRDLTSRALAVRTTRSVLLLLATGYALLCMYSGGVRAFDAATNYGLLIFRLLAVILFSALAVIGAPFEHGAVLWTFISSALFAAIPVAFAAELVRTVSARRAAGARGAVVDLTGGLRYWTVGRGSFVITVLVVIGAVLNGDWETQRLPLLVLIRESSTWGFVLGGGTVAWLLLALAAGRASIAAPERLVAEPEPRREPTTAFGDLVRHVGLCVAIADGRIHATEIAAVCSICERVTGIRWSDDALLAQAREEAQHRPPLGRLLIAGHSLSDAEREYLVRTALLVAKADGVLTPRKCELLRLVGRYARFPAERVDAMARAVLGVTLS